MVANRLVEVELVVVAFTPVKSWRVVEPIRKRLVNAARLLKKFVLVAFVVVAFTPVKFWRVVEPERRSVESDVAPVTLSVEASVAAPEVYNVPPDKAVAKKLVEVALVVVAFTPVKFWRVVEPITKSVLSVEAPEV